MTEKEKFFESVRGKVLAIFAAIASLIAALGGAFPELGLPVVVDLEPVMPLIGAVALLTAMWMWGRTQRNTKVKK